MKKNEAAGDDELRAKYDFAEMRGGVRGKHAEALRRGSNVVLLDPDVAAAFPSGDAVNEALRAVIRASRVMGRGRPKAGSKPQRTVHVPTDAEHHRERQLSTRRAGPTWTHFVARVGGGTTARTNPSRPPAARTSRARAARAR